MIVGFEEAEGDPPRIQTTVASAATTWPSARLSRMAPAIPVGGPGCAGEGAAEGPGEIGDGLGAGEGAGAGDGCGLGLGSGPGTSGLGDGVGSKDAVGSGDGAGSGVGSKNGSSAGSGEGDGLATPGGGEGGGVGAGARRRRPQEAATAPNTTTQATFHRIGEPLPEVPVPAPSLFGAGMEFLWRSVRAARTRCRQRTPAPRERGSGTVRRSAGSGAPTPRAATPLSSSPSTRRSWAEGWSGW